MKIKIILLFMMVSCSKEVLEKIETNNVDINVSYLFSHQGCSVFRFYDHGDAIYFSDCSQDFKYTKNESCGKNCTKSVNHQTMGFENDRARKI